MQDSQPQVMDIFSEAIGDVVSGIQGRDALRGLT